jgi:hypothetical protein
VSNSVYSLSCSRGGGRRPLSVWKVLPHVRAAVLRAGRTIGRASPDLLILGMVAVPRRTVLRLPHTLLSRGSDSPWLGLLCPIVHALRLLSGCLQEPVAGRRSRLQRGPHRGVEDEGHLAVRGAGAWPHGGGGGGAHVVYGLRGARGHR